jgi:hypothetical protein
LAGSAAAESGRGVAFGAAFASASVPFSVPLSGLVSEGLLAAGSAVRAGSFAGAAVLVSVGFAAGVAGAGPVVVLAAGVAGAPFEAPFVLEPFVLKYAAQLGSTLPGSRWYWSYISSTSHSLAPKSEDGAEAVSDEVSDGFVCCCGTG